MCGIAGIFSVDGLPISAADLIRMNEAIAHRGPDDEGYLLINSRGGESRSFSGEATCAELRAAYRRLTPEQGGHADLGLAHRRFSIFDLSPGGHQPFFSGDRSCCVVFNGEIYNFIEIRQELEAKGVQFRTSCDTEVIVEAYQHWGPDCFGRFNGFWALALYDFPSRKLILSRDRLGKKPLFWTRAGTSIYFASEIKALLQVHDVRCARAVNEEAAFVWLAFGRKDLNNQTLFKGIFALRAGTWSVVDEQFPQNCVRFWSLPKDRCREQDISTEEAAGKLRGLLQDAVGIRLRADVPVAVELSGGMDSSTLAALACSATGQRITTYTVRFPEQEFNEEPIARSLAGRFNIDYRVLDSPMGHFWHHITAFSRLEEEPYHYPNVQTQQEVWASMRARGTKVSLNGGAGDELFAGYSAYYAPLQTELLLTGRIGQFLDNLFHHSETRHRWDVATSPALHLGRRMATRIGPLARLRSRRRARDLSFSSIYASPCDDTFLTTILYNTMTNTRMPYWLTCGDRSSMGIPLEVRGPFLDYRVVEFAYRLPVTYLIRHGWHKWILRKAMEGLLPEDVLWRRNKMGFPFPYERFLQESAGIIQLIFSSSNNPYIDPLKESRIRYSWEAISFLLWYELFINENTALFEEIEKRAGQTPAPPEPAFKPLFHSTC